MNELEKKAYIFASVFSLAKKLQVIGDRFDANITIKQWLFLVGVSKFSEPPTVSEVAHFVGYSRQNAKRLAETLEKRGYVVMTKDKYDARALRIEMTDQCRDYFLSRYQKELDFLIRIFDGFDPVLTEGFYQGLTKLAVNVEMMLEEKSS